MTDDQINAFAERFVLCFEKLALALEGLNETYRQQFEKQYPQRGPVREAIVTRVPTEEDRIREAHGASDKPINDWLGELEEGNEDLGTREREWVAQHPEVSYARPQARPPVWGEADDAGAESDQGV